MAKEDTRKQFVYFPQYFQLFAFLFLEDLAKMFLKLYAADLSYAGKC